MHGLDGILAGEIDEIIGTLIQKELARALEESSL